MTRRLPSSSSLAEQVEVVGSLASGMIWVVFSDHSPTKRCRGRGEGFLSSAFGSAWSGRMVSRRRVSRWDRRRMTGVA